MREHLLDQLLSKVSKIEDKVTSAKSLNGGFDKLLIEVEHIKETQTAVLEGVRGVKQNLYEPDSGLFSRVKELETESQRRLEFIQESKPALEFSKELQVWKKQADKDLEQFDTYWLEEPFKPDLINKYSQLLKVIGVFKCPVVRNYKKWK